MSVAFGAFGVATISQGSGFLAAYIAGLVMGNGKLPFRSGITRVHDAAGWVSQVSMFLMLGLLITPSKLPAVAGIGLALSMFLALVARPAAVYLCMALFGKRYTLKETTYVG